MGKQLTSVSQHDISPLNSGGHKEKNMRVKVKVQRGDKLYEAEFESPNMTPDTLVDFFDRAAEYYNTFTSEQYEGNPGFVRRLKSDKDE